MVYIKLPQIRNNQAGLRLAEGHYVMYPQIAVLSLFLSVSLPDVLCDLTEVIWKKRTPFEALTVRTARSSNGLLAEVI